EGAWTDPNPPYYGGLQMDLGVMRRDGGDLLRRKGTADHWAPLEQMWTAERAHRPGRGFLAWPNTTRPCGAIWLPGLSPAVRSGLLALAEHSPLLRADLTPGSDPSGSAALPELRTQQVVDDLRVRLSLRFFHDLADEVTEETLFAASVRGDLVGARGEDGVDERLQLGCVRDDGLRENGGRVDRAGRAVGERREQRLAGDRVTPVDDLDERRAVLRQQLE